ncbi:MAG: response regulator transcription factor [Acidobacteriaceae bacterium]
MRVAVIEDEARLAENIAASLREGSGYAVDVARDGEEGLYLATTNTYDAVILDLMLPRLSGVEVLKKMRRAGVKTPVLILTARDEKESVVGLLNEGADDYLTKPFDLGELRARVQSLIRRSQGHAVPKLTLGDLEMDTVRAAVRRAGVVVMLVPMEYRVLEYMMHRPGKVVSKAELLEHLYDFNWEKFSNVIEVYIAGLRKKIDAGTGVKLIHTLRGHGYVLREGEPL